MSYFFNGDFEDFLASNEEKYEIQSSKKNQELEYFILWLENEPLYTEKKYDKDYLRFIKDLKKSDVLISTDKTNIKLWCQEIFDKKLQRVLNSKRTSTKFAIENNLAHCETKILNAQTKILKNYIYKDPLGVSGSGCWRGDIHEQKILNFLATKKVIAEPVLNRTFDIGCCVTDEKDFYYQNHVDKHFQYKGTTIGLNLKAVSWFPEYQDKINLIKNYYQVLGITAPYSIDSFLFNEQGVEKLYALSEVNARKTMGYVAIKIWQNYFSHFKYCSLKLVNSKKIKQKVPHHKIYEKFSGHVIALSPYGNIFFSFIVAADSLHDLYEYEDELFTTLFDSI